MNPWFYPTAVVGGGLFFVGRFCSARFRAGSAVEAAVLLAAVAASLCAATLLRGAGLQAAEAELAREAYTSLSGTEAWYLARAMRRRGAAVRFVAQPSDSRALPHPSIAGVRLGGPPGFGHFVAVIERTPKGYALGDPLFGRIVLPDQRLWAEYEFTGFFLKLELPPEKAAAFKVR